jgi:hypothetical protein
MASPVKEIGAATVKAATSFRDTVQDLLVPELRAIKVQIESQTQELRLRSEQQRESMQQLATEVRLRDEQQKKSIEALSQKLDFSIEFRERLAQVEARLPKQ